MKVASASAIANLTTAAPILENDVLLSWIVNLASSLQLKVKRKTKGSDLSLQLSSELVLKERNSIVRALCGMALHNALDQAPYYLMGGHAEASRKAASPIAALAMGEMASWMSVADSSVRTSKTMDASFLDSLNSHLQTRAFLVPAAACTIADLDLALALTAKGAPIESDHVHVQRWLRQCHATLKRYNVGGVAIPELPEEVIPTSLNMPVFFYGTEEFAPPSSSKKKGTARAEKRMSSTPALGDSSGNDGGLTDEQKKAAADKRAQKAAEKAAKKKKSQPQVAPVAAELDISALDIRVGRITKAWHHQEAEKLFCEEVEVGEEKPRNIASGLRPFYKTEDLQDRVVLVLCNLKARNLVGFPSHGMVLCASNADHTQVEFVVPPEGAKIGERVQFEGIEERDPEAENKVAKKKMFEKLAPDLKTNGEGCVLWKEHQATTSVGQVKALNGMPNAQVS